MANGRIPQAQRNLPTRAREQPRSVVRDDASGRRRRVQVVRSINPLPAPQLERAAPSTRFGLGHLTDSKYVSEPLAKNARACARVKTPCQRCPRRLVVAEGASLDMAAAFLPCIHGVKLMLQMQRGAAPTCATYEYAEARMRTPAGCRCKSSSSHGMSRASRPHASEGRAYAQLRDSSGHA